MTYGSEGIIHGFRCYLLQDEQGEPAPVHSCASGLDYPGVGPEHSYLKDTGRVQYVTCYDDACRDAFFVLSRKEGIIPALESAHAVAHALVKAREMKTGHHPRQPQRPRRQGHGLRDRALGHRRRGVTPAPRRRAEVSAVGR